MSDWQPIETAPKNVAVMVYGRNEFASAPYIGVREWNGYQWSEPNISAHDLDDWLDGEMTSCPLTHWMPLPDPPVRDLSVKEVQEAVENIIPELTDIFRD